LLSDKAEPDEEIMISNEGDEWNHDLDHQDYVKLKGASKTTLAAALRENSFIKLSQRLDLMQWEMAEKKLHFRIHKFLYLVNLSFRDGEKDL
jgi:hypothetical protein